MDAKLLQQRNIEAWTYLVRREPQLSQADVTAVDKETITPHVTRYQLTLRYQNDPITLIGKQTNQAEARFYSTFARRVAPLTPPCWFSQSTEMPDQGWMVLGEVEHHHAVHTWSTADLEKIMAALADLHATFWHDQLDKHHWLPAYVAYEIDGRSRPVIPVHKALAQRVQQQMGDEMSAITKVSLNYNGTQAGALLQATLGLQIIRKLGGWPGVIEQDHLDAATDLLRHPNLMLQPLSEAPQTILHGRPTAENWRVNLFDNHILLDWRDASRGAGVCDLVSFVEEFLLWCDESQYVHVPHTDHIEEVLIDSYFLRLAEAGDTPEEMYGRHYSARQMRRYALPAAQCLHTLTHWFPRFLDWFGHLPGSHHTWEMLQEMNEEQQEQHGYQALLQMQDRLAGIFDRFLDAYKLLVAL